MEVQGHSIYMDDHRQSPDDNYVDGVSVTHGTPHTHIWTYAAGVSGATSFDLSGSCPCANPTATTNILSPHFVGDNYISVNQETKRRRLKSQISLKTILSGMGSSVKVNAVVMEALHHGSV